MSEEKDKIVEVEEEQEKLPQDSNELNEEENAGEAPKKLPELNLSPKAKKFLAIAGSILVLAAIVFGGIYYKLSSTVAAIDPEKVLPNVYIEGMDVSGKTKSQLNQMFSEIESKYGAQKMTFTVDGHPFETTLGELGFAVTKRAELIDEVVSFGKEGTLWERYNLLRAQEKGEAEQHYQITYDVSDAMVKTVIDENAGPFETPAINARIEVTEEGLDKIPGQTGLAVDREKALDKLHRFLNEKWNFTESRLILPMITSEPDVKLEDLADVKDELGSFCTDAGTGDRVKNLVRGAELINGTVLMPGDEFNALNTTEPYTLDNGYVNGGAYASGEVVQSVAGGICQVTTTLYNAVLYAELEIVERHNHSMQVSYVDPSRDAAVTEGGKNLRFKNNTEHPVYIAGYLDKRGRLWFRLFGTETRPADRSVEYVSQTLERSDYVVKYVLDSGIEVGQIEKKGAAINGRSAQLVKVVKEGGKEVSRNVINKSNYRAGEVTYRVGTGSASAEAKSILKDAIATEDKATINAAIRRAKRLSAE